MLDGSWDLRAHEAEDLKLQSWPQRNRKMCHQLYVDCTSREYKLYLSERIARKFSINLAKFQNCWIFLLEWAQIILWQIQLIVKLQIQPVTEKKSICYLAGILIPNISSGPL